jgi:hypothetical protein
MVSDPEFSSVVSDPEIKSIRIQTITFGFLSLDQIQPYWFYSGIRIFISHPGSKYYLIRIRDLRVRDLKHELKS